MEITKTKPTDYIDSLSEEQKPIVEKLDKMITKLAGKRERVMWEGKFWGGSDQKIIGYGRLVYVGSNKKEVEWFAVGLAAQKNYITVFVSAADGKEYVVEKYKDKIGKAKVGKSTISFTKLEDIDLDVLEEVVKRGFELSE